MSDISKIKVSGVEYDIKDIQARGDLGNLGTRVTELEQHGGGGGSTVELDTTLTQSGKAADAKAVGDALAGKQDTISDLETIRSGAAKGATALQTVPSTYRTALAQDVIDSDLGDRISAIENKESGWNDKQDKLIAGDNITISADGKTISATGGGGSVPTNVSAFTNDAGYLTLDTLPKYEGETQ